MGFDNCLQLTLMRIINNQLTGQIPPDLYNVVSLQQPSMSSNNISGNLDAQGMMAILVNLSLLEFSYNQLKELVPEGIGKLANLEVLLLNNNQLDGSLPRTLSNCTKLRYLNLRDDSLTGKLSAIDFSSLSELQTLDLGFNNFTGMCPPAIYSYKSFIALRIRGRVEPALAGLQNLSFISLSRNRIIDINRTLKLLQGIRNLTTVPLDENFFGESRQQGVTGFKKARIFSLARSNLTGQVLPWLSLLSMLAVFLGKYFWEALFVQSNEFRRDLFI